MRQTAVTTALRRKVVLLAALTLATIGLSGVTSSSATDGAEPETRDVMFVANSESGTVSLVDVAALTVVGEIDIVPDGSSPAIEDDPVQALVTQPVTEAAAGENLAQHLEVSPDGTVLYVSRGHRADVAAFDVTTGDLLWRTPVSGLRADHMTIAHDGARLFVSAILEDMVEVVDTATGEVVGSFPTGEFAHDNKMSPDGARVYNSSIGNVLTPRAARDDRPEAAGAVLSEPYQLTIADADTLEVLDTHTFDSGIRPWVMTPDERLMYAQLSFLHGLVEYDLEERRVLRTAHLPKSAEAEQMDEDDYPFEAPHHGLAMSPDTATLCVAGRVSNYAALVSRATLEPEAIVPVGDSPGWAANSPDGQYCFIASEEAGTVSAISYVSGEEVARIPVGQHPKHLVGARVPEAVLCGARDCATFAATAAVDGVPGVDGLLAGADARSIVPMRDGEVDLTGVYLGGYGLGPYRVFGHDHGEGPVTSVGDNRPAEDVHPVEIRVQSVAFGNGAGDVVVVQSLDLQGYFIEFKECPCGVASIQERFAAETGVPAEHLLVHATHQHAGPNTLGHQGGVPRWYLEQIRDTAVASAAEAVAALESADVVTGSLYRPEFNRHRRNTYESVSDPMLVYLHASAADDPDRGIGTIVNYSGHPTILGSGNNTIHTDYPGALVRVLEVELGGVGVYLNGGVGNTSVQAPPGEDAFERAWLFGEALAGEVVADMTRGPQPVSGDTVASAVLRMEHPVTNPVLTAGSYLNVYMRSEDYITVSADPAPYPTGVFPLKLVTNVGGFRIGDAAVLWGPGEIFSAISTEARNHASWASGALVAGLGNDHAGYIMQNHEYKLMQVEEYEELQAIDPWVGDHVIDLMVQAAATLAD